MFKKTVCKAPLLLVILFAFNATTYSQGREDDMVVAKDGSGDYRYI